MASGDIYEWSGKQSFRLNANAIKEDTLRIVPQKRHTEAIFTLTLPTLCITYADMTFQNAVGGLQANYPASRAYGPVYFDPPVEIHGEQEIERLTYIRGARQVVIGPQLTKVVFPSWKELVIPRLRLERKEAAEIVFAAEKLPVQLEEPLSVRILQFADGRHIGGVNIEARHPDYQPPPVREQYDLSVRILDAAEMQPIPEVRIDVWHWDAAAAGGHGAFRLADERRTDGPGAIHVGARPSGELEAVTARLPGWRVTPRVYRPLAGEPVQITLRAWPMQRAVIRYVWQKGNTVQAMAERCGSSPQEFLKLNRLSDASGLRPGMRISIRCYAAGMRPDPGDDPLMIARRFHFTDPAVVARAIGLGDLSECDGSVDLYLPGWHFFYAAAPDTLESFDRLFQLRPGSCVAAGRAFRPRAGILFSGEVVGVPV